MQTISIDLDGCNRNYALRKAKLLKAVTGFPVEIRASSGGKGFHIRGVISELSHNEALKLRKWLGDDLRRINKDKQRLNDGIMTDVLFSVKLDENGEEEWAGKWEEI